MDLAMKKHNLKRWRKYTGTCVDNKCISALCAETSKTTQQCYDFAARHKGTIIWIKQSLNSTGSMVGIAWVTVCWGVVVCSQGWPCSWRWFLPLKTSASVNLHTVTSQTWDLNILGQQESCIEYIPVCGILMLWCWAWSSQHFKGLLCLCLQGKVIRF